MSEQINKVLASTAQSFTTAQQAQARANIGAMPQASASAFEPKITYAYDSDSAISSINGSAIGGQGGGSVYHDSNLTGSGMSGSPLGVADKVLLSNSSASSEFSLSGFSTWDTDGYSSQLTAGMLNQSGYAGNTTSFYTATRGVGGTTISKIDGGLATWGPLGTTFYNIETGYNYTAQWNAAYSGNQFYIQKTDSNNTHMSAFIYPDYFKIDRWTNRYDDNNSARETFEVRTSGITSMGTANHTTYTNFELNKNYMSLWSGMVTVSPTAGSIGSTANGTLGYINWQNDSGSTFIEVRSGDAGARSVMKPSSLSINNSLSQDANKYSMTLSLSSLVFVDETNGNDFYVFDKYTYNTLTSLSAWATAQGWTP